MLCQLHHLKQQPLKCKIMKDGINIRVPYNPTILKFGHRLLEVSFGTTAYDKALDLKLKAMQNHQHIHHLAVWLWVSHSALLRLPILIQSLKHFCWQNPAPCSFPWPTPPCLSNISSNVTSSERSSLPPTPNYPSLHPPAISSHHLFHHH